MSCPDSRPDAPAAAVVSAVAAISGFSWRNAAEPDEDFERRLKQVLDEIGPVGFVEAIVVEQFLDAVRQLRACARCPEPKAGELPSSLALRARAQADRLLWRALREIQSFQKKRGDARPAPTPAPDPEPDPEPEPTDPTTPDAPPEPEPVLDSAPTNWRERIIVEPARSSHWPVVKGTNVTVEQVAGMFAENRLVSEILRYFPALTLDDLRACRDCIAEGRAGPWEPEG